MDTGSGELPDVTLSGRSAGGSGTSSGGPQQREIDSTFTLRYLNWLALALLGTILVSGAVGACASTAVSASDACVNPQGACTATGGAGGVYPITSLPHGNCSGASLCQILIDPCPNAAGHLGGEKVDGYGCACVGGQWACTDCVHGASLCAELPDGGSTMPPPDAGRGGADAADGDDGAVD